MTEDSSELRLVVSVAQQRLSLMRGNQLIKEYPVSTSRYGTGSEDGSFRTPLGAHRIREKHGAGEPVNQVFTGRQPIGVLDDLLASGQALPDDIITSRILWLEGLEPGTNCGEGIDSYARYIYIHGTNEEQQIGTPASHGCIRMRNRDVIELFDQVETGTRVDITQD